MNDQIFEGVVIDKTPTADFTDKSGRTHTECYILVESQEMYPQRVAVQLTDDLEKHSPMVGHRVRCHLNYRISTGTSGKWFNEIKAWRVESC